MKDETKDVRQERVERRIAINDRLRDYRRLYRQLHQLEWTKKIGGEAAYEYEADEALFHAKMYEIRSRIHKLDPSPEKTFLYFYYLKGLTLEKCAAIMGVSRRTIYRVKLRALDLMAEVYGTRA